MLLGNLLRARALRRFPGRKGSVGWERATYLSGIVFGVFWTADTAVNLRSRSHAELLMQGAAGTLIAVLYGLFLISSLYPHLTLGLRSWQSAVPLEGEEIDVEELARRGDTLAAVRAYRAQTGASLRDAVDVVRAMQRQMGV